MDTTCSACVGVGSNGGLECAVCSGTGLVGLTDANFKQITAGDQIALTGVVWDSILTKLNTLTTELEAVKNKVKKLKDDHKDLDDKLDDVMDKCNDIFEKVNE